MGILGLWFLLIDLVSFGEGASFEIGYPRSTGWKNFGHRWTRGWGGWGSSRVDNFHGCRMCIIP